MSAGSVAAIVAGVVVFLVLVFGILWRRGCLGQKSFLGKGNNYMHLLIMKISFVLKVTFDV